MLNIVGAMLCLTGLGAVGGIPMILAVVLAPIIGSLIGFGGLRNGAKSFYCHVCSREMPMRKRGCSKAGEPEREAVTMERAAGALSPRPG
jgi:hypothetical protein